jgi:hypothetical protein
MRRLLPIFTTCATLIACAGEYDLTSTASSEPLELGETTEVSLKAGKPALQTVYTAYLEEAAGLALTADSSNFFSNRIRVAVATEDELDGEDPETVLARKIAEDPGGERLRRYAGFGEGQVWVGLGLADVTFDVNVNVRLTLEALRTDGASTGWVPLGLDGLVSGQLENGATITALAPLSIHDRERLRGDIDKWLFSYSVGLVLPGQTMNITGQCKERSGVTSCPIEVIESCGDGTCTFGENCETCSVDCGVCGECTDLDRDGFLAPDQSGIDCGTEVDCDDRSAQVYPGQTQSFSEAVHGSYDFNCDGLEEPAEIEQWAGCVQIGLGCGGSGWAGPVPECGENAEYFVCSTAGGLSPGGSSCSLGSRNRTQECN